MIFQCMQCNTLVFIGANALGSNRFQMPVLYEYALSSFMSRTKTYCANFTDDIGFVEYFLKLK